MGCAALNILAAAMMAASPSSAAKANKPPGYRLFQAKTAKSGPGKMGKSLKPMAEMPCSMSTGEATPEMPGVQPMGASSHLFSMLSALPPQNASSKSGKSASMISRASRSSGGKGNASKPVKCAVKCAATSIDGTQPSSGKAGKSGPKGHGAKKGDDDAFTVKSVSQYTMDDIGMSYVVFFSTFIL